MEPVIHALGSDGVSEIRVGEQACMSLGGTFTRHSYPDSAEQEAPCACGKTRRSAPVDGEDAD